MSPIVLLFVYCVLVAMASLAGGKLSSLLRMTHLRTQLLMSGVGGLMLGIAMLHMLPHGGEVLQSHSSAGAGVLIGLTVMFLMIRLFHTHDHGIPVTDEDLQAESASAHTQDHAHCGHSNHDHTHSHGHGHSDVKGISWAGLFFGLLLHTLVDGVALASSVLAEADHGAWLGLMGLGTFLAVLLHKPLDAFAITSVMSKQNWPKPAQNAANLAFSLACPAGALAFYFGATTFATNSSVLGWGLVILGIAIAVGIENLPGHSHNHAHSSHIEVHNIGDGHDHGGHAHHAHDH
jgi:zinc and cadmium transporter